VTEPEHKDSSSVLSLLRAPSVLPFISATVLLYVGLAIQVTTLGKQVYDITRRELDIGWLGLAEFLPIALLVFVTGAVADRFNRKNVAMLAISGELVSALLLTWYASTSPTSVFPIFVIAVLYGTARAFVAPSMRPMAAMIAPAGRLPQMVGLYSTMWTAAAIIGPASSGFLYSVHPSVAYGTGAVAVAAAIGLVSRVRMAPVGATSSGAASPPRERPSLRSAMEGLRFIRATPILFAAIALDLFAVLFGGAVALLPVIATEQLGVGDVAYGWLRAAAGIGAAITAVTLSIRPLRRRIGPILLVAVAIFGVGTIALGLTRTYWVAFLAVMVIHGADMVSVVIRSSIVPLATPDDKRGRVTAVENVFIGATNELGAFESGVAAEFVGVKATVVGGGVATLGIVAVWWWRFTSLRRIDRFEDVAHAT